MNSVKFTKELIVKLHEFIYSDVVAEKRLFSEYDKQALSDAATYLEQLEGSEIKLFKVRMMLESACKVVAARTKYEAVGFYLLNCCNGSGCMDDVEVEEADMHEQIEVECIGIPKYKTLEEIYKELDVSTVPCVVIGLIEG
ncbi:hypothetical protein [Bacillus mycoides]|uniref:hypothetical protein n=1 Tax=Bacillus mycoides TaxID=1405 RepID=UPI003A80B9B4